MSTSHYVNGKLLVESADLEELASHYGTPCYVYSKEAITTAYQEFSSAWAELPHKVCYAVKACSNLAILQLLAKLGSGFDIVSGGELERVIRAGGDPARTVFSGVGKQASEISMALDHNIACFNVESSSELMLIEAISKKRDGCAPISLRVNPDVDAGTHPYIATGLKENKFGIPLEAAVDLYRYAHESGYLQVKGIDCHIGSQILELEPYLEALEKVLDLVDTLASMDINVEHLDLGGGMGVRYADETPFPIEDYAAAVKQMLGHRPLDLIFEPGRSIVANAGCLLTRVLFTKENHDKRFAIVDAAMNDLLRPSLYNAWQEVRNACLDEDDKALDHCFDIVGPVCESGDFLARDRTLNIKEGDLLSVESAGAYGFVMSSNYNSRNRPAELLVDGEDSFLIRQRETIDDQLRLERLPGVD